MCTIFSFLWAKGLRAALDAAILLGWANHGWLMNCDVGPVVRSSGEFCDLALRITPPVRASCSSSGADTGLCLKPKADPPEPPGGWGQAGLQSASGSLASFRTPPVPRR